MYRINEAGAEIVESARSIAQGTAAASAADADSNGRFPSEAMAALADGGHLGLTVPTEHGGKAQSPSTFAAVVEELAQGCSSTAMIYVMHITSTQAIAASSTMGGRDALLREVAARIDDLPGRSRSRRHSD